MLTIVLLATRDVHAIVENVSQINNLVLKMCSAMLGLCVTPVRSSDSSSEVYPLMTLSMVLGITLLGFYLVVCGWMDGCVEESMDDCMNGYMDRLVDRYVHV